MTIENSELLNLKLRQEKAIEQLRSLINEQIHRQHGCLYEEVSIDDLKEVIDILSGRL